MVQCRAEALVGLKNVYRLMYNCATRRSGEHVELRGVRIVAGPQLLGVAVLASWIFGNDNKYEQQPSD